MDVSIKILFSGSLAENHYCKPFALVRFALHSVWNKRTFSTFLLFLVVNDVWLSLLSVPAAEPLQYDATWCYWLVVAGVYYILVALSTFAARLSAPPKRGTILSGTLRGRQGLPESFMSQKSQSVSFLACNLPSAWRLWQHSAAAWMTGTCQRQ